MTVLASARAGWPGTSPVFRLFLVETGRRTQTVQSPKAKPLNPDLHPWVHQPGESDAAFKAFAEYLHAEKRRVEGHGPSSFRWSVEWSWGLRAYEYDLYMAQVDLEDQVRYRRAMNERHRKIAAAAQGKLVTWLSGLDPSKMTTADATRLMAVVVDMERRATEGVEAGMLPTPLPAETMTPLTERLSGLDIELSQLARLLHQKTHDHAG